MDPAQGYVGRREDPTEALLPVSIDTQDVNARSPYLLRPDVQTWVAEQAVSDYDPIPDSRRGQGGTSPIVWTQHNTAARTYGLNPLAPWFIPQAESPSARAVDRADACSETKSSSCTSRTYCASPDWSGTTACTNDAEPGKDITGQDFEL